MQCKWILISVFHLCLISHFADAKVQEKIEEVPVKKEPIPSPIPSKEMESITEHKIKINDVEFPYKAVAGKMDLKDDQGNVKANFFYVSYVRTDTEPTSPRPIAFCFNGGPGSSSVWLHMGILGPKRVLLSDHGISDPPYRYVENEYSILDVMDLVFIDPVSTGYSRAASGEDLKQFHGVEEDVKWVSEFVRLYTTRNGRWDSPKFLIGESYGTTRAAAMAGYLHEELNMYLNGVILVSSVLDFQTLDKFDCNNDLPYILYLPSYTAAAWYHQKLQPELQKDLAKALHEVEKFSFNEYSLALLKGDQLPLEKRKEIIEKLSYFTGLSQEYIDNTNLRINILKFTKELLRKNNRSIGRFDSSITGIENNKCSEYIEYDPSMDSIFGAFTSTFNQYIRTDLKWMEDENYRIIADVQPWSYGKASNRYLNVANTLRDTMTRNPNLYIFVGNGYYDLATPYFSTEYTFNHLNLDPSIRDHVTMEYYFGGHMMYTNKPSLIKMSNDLRTFIGKTVKQATDK